MLKLSSQAVKAVNACTGKDVEVKLINGTHYQATLTVKFSKYRLEFSRYYYPPALFNMHGKQFQSKIEAIRWVGHKGQIYEKLDSIDSRVHGIFDFLESNTKICNEEIKARLASLQQSLKHFKEEMGIH